MRVRRSGRQAGMDSREPLGHHCSPAAERGPRQGRSQPPRPLHSPLGSSGPLGMGPAPRAPWTQQVNPLPANTTASLGQPHARATSSASAHPRAIRLGHKPATTSREPEGGLGHCSGNRQLTRAGPWQAGDSDSPQTLQNPETNFIRPPALTGHRPSDHWPRP